jgi:hypothetical protein
MAKFRKKPVVIDAILWDRTNVGELRTFFGAFLSWHFGQFSDVLIKTLEGTMRAESGDYIIRGVKGEFYPCKPDIFAATYEPLTAHPEAGTPKGAD